MVKEKCLFEGFLLSVDENPGNLLRRAADKGNKKLNLMDVAKIFNTLMIYYE